MSRGGEEIVLVHTKENNRDGNDVISIRGEEVIIVVLQYRVYIKGSAALRVKNFFHHCEVPINL